MSSRVSDSGVRRVLMSADAVGGVWTYALTLARGLDALGIDVEIVVLGPPPTVDQRAEAAAIRRLQVLTTGLPLDWTARDSRELDVVADRLRARAQIFRADVVHLNAPAHAGRRPWPMPLVVSAHSCVATWWRAMHDEPLPDDLAWRRDRTAAGLSIADLALAPSRAFAAALAAAYPSARQIHTVYNGSDFEPIEANGARDLFVTAGRLWDPAKNVATVDRAATLSRLPVIAAGAAEGPNGEKALLTSLELIGVLGRRDMQLLLSRTAVHVSVPKYEPFGLAVLEAARAGAALVLSDIPTLREIWHDSAIFVPVDDAAQLAATLSRLANDTVLREMMAAKAAARACQFTLDATVDGTLAVYAAARAQHRSHAIG